MILDIVEKVELIHFVIFLHLLIPLVSSFHTVYSKTNPISHSYLRSRMQSSYSDNTDKLYAQGLDIRKYSDIDFDKNNDYGLNFYRLSKWM